MSNEKVFYIKIKVAGQSQKLQIIKNDLRNTIHHISLCFVCSLIFMRSHNYDVLN